MGTDLLRQTEVKAIKKVLFDETIVLCLYPYNLLSTQIKKCCHWLFMVVDFFCENQRLYIPTNKLVIRIKTFQPLIVYVVYFIFKIEFRFRKYGSRPIPINCTNNNLLKALYFY